MRFTLYRKRKTAFYKTLLSTNLLKHAVFLLNVLVDSIIFTIFAIEDRNHCIMIKSLTAKEEVLMNIFWAHGPLFIRDVISYLPEPKPHYNTIATLVKILEKKGFLEREPMANSFRHKVKISERQYRGRKVSDVVANHYNNSYLSLVSQFVEEEKIDLADLKALIASIEKQQS